MALCHFNQPHGSLAVEYTHGGLFPDDNAGKNALVASALQDQVQAFHCQETPIIIKYLYPRSFDTFTARNGFFSFGDRHKAQVGGLDGRNISYDNLKTGLTEHHANIEMRTDGGS